MAVGRPKLVDATTTRVAAFLTLTERFARTLRTSCENEHETPLVFPAQTTVAWLDAPIARTGEPDRGRRERTVGARPAAARTEPTPTPFLDQGIEALRAKLKPEARAETPPVAEAPGEPTALREPAWPESVTVTDHERQDEQQDVANEFGPGAGSHLELPTAPESESVKEPDRIPNPHRLPTSGHARGTLAVQRSSGVGNHWLPVGPRRYL